MKSMYPLLECVSPSSIRIENSKKNLKIAGEKDSIEEKRNDAKEDIDKLELQVIALFFVISMYIHCVLIP